MKKLLPFFIIFIFHSGLLISQSLDDYLIAYWSFDDSTATDNTGNGYNGTLVNSPKPDVGIRGACYRFKGKDKYIEVNQSKTLIGDYIQIPRIKLENYSEFTISLWANEERLEYWGGSGYIFFGEVFNAWAGIYHAGHFPDPTLWVKFSSGSINDENEPIKFDYDSTKNRKWIHYALVYKKGIIFAYVNGSLIGTKYQPILISGNTAGISTNYWYYDGEHRQSAAFTGRIDEVKIYSKALTDEEIKQEIEPCTSWFDYKNFDNTNELLLVGKAQNQKPSIRLTSNTKNEAGAVWFERKIPTNNNFTTEFSFLFTGGSNDNVDDGSLPGADGIAFVIQNSNSSAIGWLGGDLGYNAMDNALAIEFDLYKNVDENHLDPNGNHVALQVSNSGKLFTKHSTEYTLAMNDSLAPILNGVVYYSRIEYNYSEKRMKVYLDKELPCDSLVIDYAPLDIPAIINQKKNLAYFGITAATGEAFENHFLRNWNLCANSLPTSIEENEYSTESNISPNPATDLIDIKLEMEFQNIIKIEIYDYIGIKQKEIPSNLINYNSSKNSVSLDIAELPKGFYLIKIISKTNQVFKKFVKN